ncbi:MAG: hypothetical protein ABI967_06675 [bacterium]
MKRSQFVTASQEGEPKRMRFSDWIKRLGLLGFLFFLFKGLLWLTIPTLIAIFAN